MRRSAKCIVGAWFWALVIGGGGGLVTALPAYAATLYVGNNGSDAFVPTCGAKATPCRSISKAIFLAASGDTIIVGPGVYGDLNQNGTFEPAAGEEAAEIGSGCDCMIKVTKPLTIQSRDGARVTVLDARGLAHSVVHILAPGADGTTFGKANKGFTIRSGTLDGLLTDSSATRLAVQGNVASGNGTGFNVSGAGGGANTVKVADNIARGNSADGFLLGGTANLLQRNRSVRNQNGFAISGATHTVIQNVASQNAVAGYVVTLSTGNTDPVSNFSGNSAIVNGAGISVVATSALSSNLTIKTSNMYGNGDGAGNCGLNLLNSDGANTLTVTATGNFWGAASGPGANPADAVCSSGTVAVTVSTPHSKEFGVGEKALK